MTRDEARKVWDNSGLTYAVLTKENVDRLKAKIDAELRGSGLIKKFRAARARVWISAGDVVADIRCSAYYFTGRQAVTFERNGFIGFAGWADDTNIQPILRAFCAWINDLRK